MSRATRKEVVGSPTRRLASTICGNAATASSQTISPLLLKGRDDIDSVGGLPASEKLGDFGGFLQPALRRNDFAIGYSELLAWQPPKA